MREVTLRISLFFLGIIALGLTIALLYAPTSFLIYLLLAALGVGDKQ